MRNKYIGIFLIIGCLLTGCGQNLTEQGSECISDGNVLSENVTLSEDSVASENEIVSEDTIVPEEGVLLQTEYLTITEDEIIERTTEITVDISDYTGEAFTRSVNNIYFRMEGEVEDYILYQDFLMGKEMVYDSYSGEYYTLMDCASKLFRELAYDRLGVDIFLYDMQGDETKELFLIVSKDIEDVQMVVFGYEDGQLTYDSEYAIDFFGSGEYFLNGGRLYLRDNGVIEKEWINYYGTQGGGAIHYYLGKYEPNGQLLRWYLSDREEHERMDEDVYRVIVGYSSGWQGWDAYGGQPDAFFYITENGKILEGDEEAWEVVEQAIFMNSERIKEIRWLAGPEEGAVEIVERSFWSGSYWTYLVEGALDNFDSSDEENTITNEQLTSISLNDLEGNYLITINVPDGYTYIPEWSDTTYNRDATFLADGEEIWISSYVTQDLHTSLNGTDRYLSSWSSNVKDYDFEVTELEPVADGKACYAVYETYTFQMDGEILSTEENYYICVPYQDVYDNTELDFVNIKLGDSASEWTTEQFQELAYEVFGE